MSRRFGSPTPGAGRKDERKKRRWQSRSDEEIERALDNRDLHYRHGWPQLPPLPVSESREGARSMVSGPQDVINTVQLLCDTHHVDVKQVYFAFRTPEVKTSGEHYLTLIITADLTRNPIVAPLIIQTRKVLQSNNVNEEITIEVIDYRVVHGLYTFAIPPSEEHLVDVWQRVYDEILAEISGNKESWLTLEILYRGMEDDAGKCPATVVITSPTAANAIWIDRILPRCRQRLHHIAPHLKIELLCGTSTHAASQGCSIDAQAYSHQVPMGSSIGQKDLPNHSGTVGGAVTLSNGKAYALTNHHVVRNDELDKLLSGTKPDHESPALQPGNSKLQGANHRFTSPSNQDNTAYIEERVRYEHQWVSQVNAGVASAQQQLTSTRAELSTARTTNRNFGTLLASSGLRTVKSEKLASDPSTGKLAPPTGKTQFRFMLDWALLDMLPSRSVINALPMRPHDSSNTGTYPKLMSGQQCTRWTTMNNPKAHILRDEVNVGKFGRTTAWTFGFLNAIPTIINPESEGGQFKFMAETYGLTVKDSGYCLSMIGHNGAAVGVGDSGSIVMHSPSGDWLGLLFGETRTKAALITPIDLVFRDIESITGLTVVEPVFNANW